MNLRATGFLLWPGNDGLRPYERRRMARKYARTVGKPPRRERGEVEYLLRHTAATVARRDETGRYQLLRDDDGNPVRRPADHPLDDDGTCPLGCEDPRGSL